MAKLMFKGEFRMVKLTHNVISEFIRLNDTEYSKVMELAGKDPMGWLRDITYCGFKVYEPELLGEMTLYDVGDEIEKLEAEDSKTYMTELFEDFVKVSGIKKKVAEKAEK